MQWVVCHVRLGSPGAGPRPKHAGWVCRFGGPRSRCGVVADRGPAAGLVTLSILPLDAGHTMVHKWVTRWYTSGSRLVHGLAYETENNWLKRVEGYQAS